MNTERIEETETVVIKAGDARALSARSQALQAIGKELMRQSLGNAQDFCKFMIGTSSGAIPVYIGLLTFAIPDRESLQLNIIWAIIPPLLFLIAMIIFTAGYLPVKGEFSLEVISEIEDFRERTLKRRNTLLKAGVTLFSLGTLWASVVIILGLYFF